MINKILKEFEYKYQAFELSTIVSKDDFYKHYNFIKQSLLKVREETIKEIMIHKRMRGCDEDYGYNKAIDDLENNIKRL